MNEKFEETPLEVVEVRQFVSKNAPASELDKEFVKTTKRLLRKNWQKGNFEVCCEILEGLDGTMWNTFQKVLTDILYLNPDFFPYSTEEKEAPRKVRHKVLDILEQTPDGIALPILVSALFIEDEILIERITAYLQTKQKKPLSPLIRRLRASYYTEDPIKKQGIKRLIRLLGELQDKRASAVLLEVASGKLLSLPPSSASSCTLFSLTGVATYLLASIYPEEIGAYSWEVLVAFWFLAYMPLHLISTVWSRWSRRRKESHNNAEMIKEALNALALIPNKRNLAAILYLRRLPRMERSTEYHALLKAHFNLLNPDDRSLFQPADILWLARNLERYSPPFALTALKGLEFVGGEESVDYVYPLTKEGVAVEIREEARRVLPKILARTEAHRERQELLRASDAPIDHDTLLRPVKEKYDPQEEQELVRPTHGEE